MTEQLLTLKCPITVPANRGNDAGVYPVKARSIQGEVTYHSEDDEYEVKVHTAQTNEAGGTLGSVNVGRFKRSLDQCCEDFKGQGHDSKGNNQFVQGREVYWSLGNREFVQVFVPAANVDGLVAAQRVSPTEG